MDRKIAGAVIAGITILVLLLWVQSVPLALAFLAGAIVGWTMAGREIGWQPLPETTTDAPFPGDTK